MDVTALFKLSYGMYAVTALYEDKPYGCIANTVVQATSDNPTFTVCLNKNNYTTELVRKTGRVAISVLSEQTDPGVIKALGYSSGRDSDKFASLRYELHDSLPIIDSSCCSYLTGDVVAEYDAETHVVFLVRVKEAENLTAAEPMTYAYFHRVVKGKAPENAPTYVEEKAAPAEATPGGDWYECSICGYRVQGLDQLPDDWVCPLCGVGKECFKKVV